MTSLNALLGVRRRLRLRHRLRRALMWRCHRQLRKSKHGQQPKFYALRVGFPHLYETVKTHVIDHFMVPSWRAYNASLEKALLPYPPFGFLNNRTITDTMFVAAGGVWLRSELEFLEKMVAKEKLGLLLVEDYVGDPILLNSRYLTSHNSVHHLCHLLRFQKATRCDLAGVRVAVEWGGGYGNMAKMFWRLADTRATYVVIDTPLLSCLQWLYLSTTVDEKTVHLVADASDNIIQGAINLVPLGLVNMLKIKADLFISTWGLSECSRAALDHVIERDWYGAAKLLLAYQSSSRDFPEASSVGDAAAGVGALVEAISFPPGHLYGFR